MDLNNITEAVVQTTEKVFESMVFMKIKGEPFQGKISIGETHLTAMVGFAGAYVGLAAIHCSERFTRKIAASMLMTSQEKLTAEDVRDALGEVSNMIAGHFKAKLAEQVHTQEQVFEQSVPSVIAGDDFETFAVTDAPRYTAKCTVNEDVFFVEMALKKT
jgi:chemotaxis protein CheX